MKYLPLLFFLVSALPASAQIRVTQIVGDAEVIRAGAPDESVPLAGGEILGPDDRIVTGMDTTVQLVFGEDSVVVVRELTDVKIADFAAGDDQVRTRLWLKAGEVSADLLHKQGAPSSDFAIKTPTATCSVRGSGVDVRHVDGETQQNTRHGDTALIGNNGVTQNQGAGQQGNVDSGGNLDTDTEIRAGQSLVLTQAPGITRQEAEAVLNGGPLTNVGGGAPNDPGSTAGGNVPVNLFNGVIEVTTFQEVLAGTTGLPGGLTGLPGGLTGLPGGLTGLSGATGGGGGLTGLTGATGGGGGLTGLTGATGGGGGLTGLTGATGGGGGPTGLTGGGGGLTGLTGATGGGGGLTGLTGGGGGLTGLTGGGGGVTGFSFAAQNGPNPGGIQINGPIGPASFDRIGNDRFAFFRTTIDDGGTTRGAVLRYASNTGLGVLVKTGVSTSTDIGGGSVNVKFTTFSDTIDSDKGRVAFHAFFDVGQNPFEGIFIHDGVDLHTLADNNGAHSASFTFLPPGSMSNPNHAIAVDLSISKMEVAFVGDTAGPVFSHIFRGDLDGNFAPLVNGNDSDGNGRVFENAPLTSFRGIDYEIASDGSGGVDRSVAFVANRTATPGGLFAGTGVYVKDFPGSGGSSLRMVADTFTTIPSIGGSPYVADPTASFQNFESVSLDGGKVAFIGSGSVASVPFQGIFTDRTGSLTNIVNTLEPFTPFGGSPINFVNFESVILDQGALTFAGTQLDGTRGIFQETGAGNNLFVPVIDTTQSLPVGEIDNVQLGVNGAGDQGGAVVVTGTSGAMGFGGVLVTDPPGGALAPVP